jgi:hypothetical protein
MNFRLMFSNIRSLAGVPSRRSPVASAVVVPKTEARAPASRPTGNQRTPTTKPVSPARLLPMDDVPQEDDEAELLGATAESKARDRERARCAAILGSAGGVRNPVVARTLAFSTSMSRREAIATLDALPEPAPSPASFRGARISRRDTGREFS